MEDRKAFASIVMLFPPEKSAEDDTIVFKFGLKDGTVLRLAMATPTAKHFATRLLLVTGGVGN